MNFTVNVADWDKDQEQIKLVRQTVFIEEQKVPEDLEWDGLDEQCIHLLARDADNNAIGTARLLPHGHIGRMSVMKAWRGKGVGKALLNMLCTLARQQNVSQMHLSAQVQAQPFYEKLGFIGHGDTYIDAGIPHRRMTKDL